MSVLQTSTTRPRHDAREQLHQDVRWSAQRGRLLASLSVLLLCAAALVGGLFVVAIKDAVFVLPQWLRAALLVVLLMGALVCGVLFALRPWLQDRFTRAAGAQIDQVAQATQQPVTVGLSLNEPTDDDTLALMLIRRAEVRAADVSKTVTPGQAYPLRRLLVPTSWLAFALGLWLLLAMLLPHQAFGVFSRVMMPWGDAPPFSLTQLEPTWTPEPPDAGDDVTVSVVPTGMVAESVDWVRLDQAGQEAERFAMASDGQGRFRHLLKRVESPIDFRLEAFGRHTRTYTITPTPRPPAPRQDNADTGNDDSGDAGTDGAASDGETTYDPDKIARRDLNAHEDWPGLRDKLEKLIDELGEAQAMAEGADPLDAEAMAGLADKLAQLTGQAKTIAEELAAMQGELPADAAALLDELADALANMRSAALPGMPGSGEASPGRGEPTPSQWRQQAAEAVKVDKQQLGLGLGPSDLPTESGIGSGSPGQEKPDLLDPSTSGTYRESNTSGDEGPLPNAVMQQVPPSYREFVSAYFEKLADE